MTAERGYTVPAATGTYRHRPTGEVPPVRHQQGRDRQWTPLRTTGDVFYKYGKRMKSKYKWTLTDFRKGKVN